MSKKKKKKKKIKKKAFKSGDTVVFDPTNFNPNFWNNLTEEEKIRYYGPLGYGSEKLKLFTFICHIKPQLGHCVLVDLYDGKVEVMRHTNDFRLATDDEC